MATTKGLGKMSDYVTEQFDGKKPNEFNEFLENFELGIDTLEIHPTKQPSVLINLMASRPRDVARKIVKKFQNDHPSSNIGT